MTQRCDAIVIGAGQAGPFLAVRLAAAGWRVAIVERKHFGGTCVNNGCMPTKAMVASAYAAHLARRAADFGVTIEGTVGVDMRKVKARKDAIVLKARQGVERWLRGTENVEVVIGHARFESPTRVRVGETLLEAPNIFVNVGGRASVPAMPGIADVPYLTSESIMEVDALPEHLLVVGGSYIGLEFAQAYRRFGARVTVIEKAAQIIPREDPDVSQAVREILAAEGIAIETGAECIALGKRGDQVAIALDCGGEGRSVTGSHVLLAVGRVPNTDDLGLDAAGVATDARGYITVDGELRTSTPGIWAMGDCNGRGAFTHTAYNDFEVLAGNLLEGGGRTIDERIPAYALFIDPPLGRVGQSVTEAKRSGRPVLVGMRPMTRVGRAVEKGETLGFMKIVVDAQSERILGAAILGTSGDEAIHAVLDSMAAGATYTSLQRTMHIHPTVAELIPTLLGELKPAS
jgi:pyruvate/2-oxoglutarate dehydrogenase complex dihydrolipoamide dehydrogenase (E3) component